MKFVRLKTTNINKVNKINNLNITKTNIKIGHTNSNLKIYLNNKNILNRFLKLTMKLSKHSYVNLLCTKYYNSL